MPLHSSFQEQFEKIHKNDQQKISDSQRWKNKSLNSIGNASGGFLLGIASGGTVLMSAMVLGELTPVMLFSGLLGSAVLALSWALLYSKPIGPALIKAMSNTPEQNAFLKIKSRFEKDISKLAWFATDLNQSTPKAMAVSESDRWVLKSQLQYLTIKAIYKALKSHENYENAYSITNTLLRRKKPTLLNFERTTSLAKLTKDLHSKEALQLDRLLKIMQEHKADTDVSDILDFKVSANNKLTAENFLAHAKQVMESNRKNMPSLLNPKAYDVVHFNYMRKLEKIGLANRVSVAFSALVGKFNAVFVNTFGMFLGGLGLTATVYNIIGKLFVASPALPTLVSWVAGGLFAIGGLAGAWFLTQSTVVKATKNFFKSMRKPQNNDEVVARKAFKEVVKKHHVKSRVKDAPVILKILLSLLTGIGFAGFNLISSMSAAVLMLNPSMISQISKIPGTLFTSPQPAFVWLSGALGATVTIFIVTTFMLKFSFDYKLDNKNNSKVDNDHFLTTSWVISSVALNTFVTGIGYFKSTAWSSIFASIGAPTAVFYVFGTLMLIAVTAMCLPVFNDPDITRPLNRIFKPSSSLMNQVDPTLNRVQPTHEQDAQLAPSCTL